MEGGSTLIAHIPQCQPPHLGSRSAVDPTTEPNTPRMQGDDSAAGSCQYWYADASNLPPCLTLDRDPIFTRRRHM